MTYKEAKIKYEEELKERINKINEVYLSAKKEIKNASSESYAKAKKNEKEVNEAPCSVCKNTTFVLKYRDVNGKIEGKISGSFSLFGGSISGYIDGTISTAPVLSCRECENERKIVINSWDSEQCIWNRNKPYFWCSYSPDPASKWLQDRGLEVAKMIDTDFYGDLKNYDDEVLEKVGLVKKFPLPKKPRWWNFIF